MRLTPGLLAPFALMGCAAAEPEAALAPRVAAAEDWAVFAEAGADGAVCWIAAPPLVSETAGRGGERGAVFLMTAVAPEHLPGPEVSYVAGWPLHPGSARLDIGANSYAFIAEGAVAWVDDERLEPDLVEDLRGAREAVARSVSADGRAATDRFSLMGYTAALAEAERLCA